MCPCLVRATAMRRHATQAGKSTLSQCRISERLVVPLWPLRHASSQAPTEVTLLRQTKWDATPATEAKEPVRSRFREGASGAAGRHCLHGLVPDCSPLGRRPTQGQLCIPTRGRIQKTQLDWNPFAQHQPAQKSTTLGWGRRMSCRTRGPREGGNQANRAPTPEAVAGGQFSDMRRHYGRTCTFKSSRRVRSDVHSENCSWSDDVLFHFDYPACRPIQIIVFQGKCGVELKSHVQR